MTIDDRTSRRTALRQESVPQGLLLAVGLLLSAALVLAVFAKDLDGDGRAFLSGDESDLTRQMMLQVEDRPDGALLVLDAGSGAVLETVDSNSNGFIRGAFRGLARERIMRGIGSGEPFRLRLWRDGTLVLDDPATGQIVALNAFGRDNAKAFGKFLMTKSGGMS